MDNKSELSKPVAWSHRPDINAPIDVTENEYVARNWRDVHGRIVQPLYSQEYVSALLERIAELERANQSQDDHINQQQDRIDSLEKTNTGLGRRLGDAEKRLGTPVRLSCETHPRCRTQHAKDVRAAGFTVEGDE
jgi:uncharacterized protein (UPF0305 family)